MMKPEAARALAIEEYFRAEHACIRINFMIECFVSGEPGVNIWPGGWDSIAGKETRLWLKSQGLIDPETEMATERGIRWIVDICNTPVPPPTLTPEMMRDIKLGYDG